MIYNETASQTYSALSGRIIVIDGVRFRINMLLSRLDSSWTLEVEDEHGCRHWLNRYKSDFAARDAALNALKRFGAAEFRQNAHVLSLACEPDFIASSKSTQVVIDGHSFSIDIYRARSEKMWSLEVMDQEGHSRVWRKLFASDIAARDTAIAGLGGGGAMAFRFPEKVMEFRTQDPALSDIVTSERSANILINGTLYYVDIYRGRTEQKWTISLYLQQEYFHLGEELFDSADSALQFAIEDLAPDLAENMVPYESPTPARPASIVAM